MSQFQLGDAVKWSSQAQGYRKEKHGTVVQIVEAGHRPDRERFLSLYRGSGCGFGRRALSYVVQVGSKFYWPRESSIVADGGCNHDAGDLAKQLAAAQSDAANVRKLWAEREPQLRAAEVELDQVKQQLAAAQERLKRWDKFQTAGDVNKYLSKLEADLAAAQERAQKAEAELANASKRWTMWKDGAEAGFVFNQMRKLGSTLGINEADFRPYKFIDTVAKLKADANAAETARKQAVEALKALRDLNTRDAPRKLDAALTWRQNEDRVYRMVDDALSAQPDAAPNAAGAPKVEDPKNVSNIGLGDAEDFPHE